MGLWGAWFREEQQAGDLVVDLPEIRWYRTRSSETEANILARQEPGVLHMDYLGRVEKYEASRRGTSHTPPPARSILLPPIEGHS